MKSTIREKEVSDWKIFFAAHPNMQITQAVFDHLTPSKFWSITDHYPDLVRRLHGTDNANGKLWAKCRCAVTTCDYQRPLFYCKEGLDDVYHFFLWEWKAFRENFQTVWSNLFQKIDSANPTDGLQISCFIRGLNRQHQSILLLCGIPLSSDQHTKIMVKKYQCTAVAKIYRIRKTMLSELGGGGKGMAEKLVCFISLDKFFCHL